jgi:tetratricopeptide (TPR) repeat protein
MLGLWLKVKASAGLVAWVAPHVRQWHTDREIERDEAEQSAIPQNLAESEVRLEEAANRSSPARRALIQLRLAEAQRKQGEENPAKLDDAETTIRGALALTASLSDPSGYLQCLDALAMVYHDRTDFRGMQALIEEGLRIESSVLHPDPARMARRMHGLAISRLLQGEDPTAVLEKAVELHEKAFGEDHAETGNVLTDLGNYHRAHGNHEEAQRNLERALKIHSWEIGHLSPEAVRDVHNLAGSYAESGDVPKAAALYERTLELKDREVGTDQEDLAEMQFAVAELYVGWEHISGARELLAMCIGTFRRKRGPRLAVAYELLAHIEEISGRYFSAISELELAAKVWAACGPDKAEELATNLEHRANLLDQLKRKDSANWLREKAVAARSGGQST